MWSPSCVLSLFCTISHLIHPPFSTQTSQLVREMREEQEASGMREKTPPPSPTKKKGSKRDSKGKPKRSSDEKNIRRRVYDALNVLHALEVISKDKKGITWLGMPNNVCFKTVIESAGGSYGSNDIEDESELRRLEEQSKKEKERIKKLKEEKTKREADIKKKKECLQELMSQNVCFNNLFERNNASLEALVASSGLSSNYAATAADDDDDGDALYNGNVREMTEEKIPLPFIVVNTNSKAVIQCEMCPERTNVSFDFSLPYEINDDNEILKRLGM